jgi:glutathione S-transferase
MRARLALHASRTSYELREVQLRDKPASLLQVSSKGSVPVLVLPDGRVIDESWDIMRWALMQQDPPGWMRLDRERHAAAEQLVAQNDTTFKYHLDRYKYPQRFPEHTQAEHRTHAEQFLRTLEDRLEGTAHLLGDPMSIADAALFPFVRQFAGVDTNWFANSSYPSLRRWLGSISGMSLATEIMAKHQAWKQGDQQVSITFDRRPEYAAC